MTEKYEDIENLPKTYFTLYSLLAKVCFKLNYTQKLIPHGLNSTFSESISKVLSDMSEKHEDNKKMLKLFFEAGVTPEFAENPEDADLQVGLNFYLFFFNLRYCDCFIYHVIFFNLKLHSNSLAGSFH